MVLLRFGDGGQGVRNWGREGRFRREMCSRRIDPTATHSSGLFCVSMTAAMGIPKFDTGPQKSAKSQRISLVLSDSVNPASPIPPVAIALPDLGAVVMGRSSSRTRTLVVGEGTYA